MDASLATQAELHLAYLARAGVAWKVDRGELLLHPVDVLTELDLASIRASKPAIIDRIRQGNLRDDFRWPERFNTPLHRARALPRSLPQTTSRKESLPCPAQT